MFQLIVVVLAVAIVATIAIAMIFFGGSVFSSGGDRALYAQLMNHGSQIEGAMKLYQSDYGNFPGGNSGEKLQSLLNNNSSGQNYLTTVPQGEWRISQGVIYRKLVDDQQCTRVNVVAKMPNAATVGCPSCLDADYAAWPGCTQPELAENAQ
jgi:hypothetical protein